MPDRRRLSSENITASSPWRGAPRDPFQQPCTRCGRKRVTRHYTDSGHLCRDCRSVDPEFLTRTEALA